MRTIQYICLIIAFISGLLVAVLAVAKETALPPGIASDIMSVIIDAPEIERSDAARKFLEDFPGLRFFEFKLLGGLILGCSLVSLALELLLGRTQPPTRQPTP